MKNLKKTLAVVLAFAMILSMGAVSTFAAYSDVTAGTIVSEAVDVLSGLKILTGFEDGTFKPEDTVTRAQMAAIICRTLGYEDQAQSSMGSTVFTDVPASHWASGYINVAQAQQIINGYGNGQYGPEDLVTYEQAVKMIVSALGYDIAAEGKGGYPTGYLAIASAEGITKNSNGLVGSAAKRGTIAVLVYNSLEVRLMDQTAWSTDGTDTYQKDNANILTTYLDVVKVEGTVIANPITEAAAYGAYVPDSEPFVTIDGDAWVFGSTASYEGYRPYNKEPIGTVQALQSNGRFDAERVDVNNLAGKYVIAYIGHDEVTDRETVFAITESKNRNTSIKISANKLVETGHKWFNEAGYVGYKDGGAKRLSLAANAVLYKNFDNLGTGYNTTSAIAGLLGNGGIVEFVSNDGDDEIEYIFVTAYENEAVIEKVEEVNGSYLFEAYNPGANLSKIDPNNDSKLFVIYKDGVAATAADLAVNDTISTVKVAKNFYIYYASSATVTGAVEGYNPDEGIVTIGGTDYEVSKQEYYSAGSYQVAKLAGEEGIFFLNVDGQIAYNETAPVNGGSYALITALYKKTSGISEDYVQVVLADGTVAEYQISDRISVVDADNNTYNNIDTKGEFLTEYQAKLTATTQADGQAKEATSYFAKKGDFTAASNLLVKLAVNSSGVVTKVRLLDGTAQNANGKYDEAAITVGNKEFDENAVIFSVKTNTVGTNAAIKATDVKVGAIADFFADDELYTLVGFDEEDSVFSAGVGVDLAKALAADGAVFVVSGRKNVSYNDDDAYVITGMMAGEEMSITIYNEDGYNGQNPAVLQAGDVLAIAEPNEEGIVSEFELLNDFVKSAPATSVSTQITTAKVDDEIAQGFGALVSADNKKFAIDSAVAYAIPVQDPADTTPPYSTIANLYAANANISYRDANYTLVDFSEDYKYPAVTAEGASKALFDFDSYVTYVFVRAVEGKLADVVVYRMSEKSDLVITADTVEAGDGVITFTENADTVTLSNLVYTIPGVTLSINGDQIDVDAGTLAAGNVITVDYTLTKAGYANVTGTLTITVVAP